MLPDLAPIMQWNGLQFITMRIPHALFGEFYEVWRTNGYVLAAAQADGSYDVVSFRRVADYALTLDGVRTENNALRCEVEKLQTENASEVQELRKMLAVAFAGAALYGDDGELQDNTQQPFIDWKRDSLKDIKAKLQTRAEENMRRIQEMKGQARIVPLVQGGETTLPIERNATTLSPDA